MTGDDITLVPCGCPAATVLDVGHQEGCSARDYIAEQPGVAKELRRLDEEGERAGWDGPLARPWVFMLARNDRDGRVRAGGLDLITAIVHRGMEFDLSAGDSLVRLADISEEAGVFIRTGPDEHLITAGPGWTLTGIGIRAEAWMLIAGDDEEYEERLRAGRERRIDKHPEKIECRFVQVVTKDGLLWWLNRRRGDEPRVVVEELGAGLKRGNVPHGLARVLNAVLPTLVPVPKR